MTHSNGLSQTNTVFKTKAQVSLQPHENYPNEYFVRLILIASKLQRFLDIYETLKNAKNENETEYKLAVV